MAFPAIAASVLLVFLLGRPLSPSIDTRIKGADLRILAYVKGAQGAEALADGAALCRGDQIQFSFLSAIDGYGTLLSIDGRGSITMIMPLSGESSVAIKGGSSEMLHYSYRLDDAPEFEDFYLVVFKEPFSLEIARSALRDMGARGTTEPIFPDGYRFARFHVVKKENAK